VNKEPSEDNSMQTGFGICGGLLVLLLLLGMVCGYVRRFGWTSPSTGVGNWIQGQFRRMSAIEKR
jgi:hypothetical protein